MEALRRGTEYLWLLTAKISRALTFLYSSPLDSNMVEVPVSPDRTMRQLYFSLHAHFFPAIINRAANIISQSNG